MERVGTVEELWRYPVKSMGGERCRVLEVDERGVAGDRRYAVRDEQGRLGSGKSTLRFTQLDGLLEYAAALTDTVPEIRCPDGHVFRADDPELHRLLSGRFGRPVSVAPERDVSHMDAAPLHLLTTASLNWIEQQQGSVAADVRRFRPNLVLKTDGAGLEEHAWPGSRLRIGEALEVLVVDTTERCRMVTLAQGNLAEVPGLLRRIGLDAGLQFGVYADVLSPGPIRAGDPVYRFT